uniref:Putative ribonuclease H-like domain-containing protein n=1 Tax=Tanacetum cinerariifolium TaxID=118510 RepID=A0A699GW28_TANCI|nr:putative ribonuclease H-like domain-containing protein [Tanacetum cinerariifolium]
MQENLQQALKDKGVIDSGYSRYMTSNISYLSNFKEISGGYVAFGRIQNVVRLQDILDESNLWHRRLGHINFKTMNKSVKGNLVRGFPSKVFENNLTCVACKKGKQHRASYKTKPVSSVSQPLQRVLVTKPYNKTPYELLLGRTPIIGFMRPFGCLVTIINTLDPLGNFDGKADERFLVGYSINSKAFRVSCSQTRIVQETLHINFLENQPSVAGSGPTWLFDIDTLTQSMNYEPIIVGINLILVQVSKNMLMQKKQGREMFNNITNEVTPASAPVTSGEQNSTNITNSFNAVGPFNSVVSPNFEIGGKSSFVDPSQYPNDPNMLSLEDITYSDDEEDVGAKANFSNLKTSIIISPILTTRVHKDHPVSQIFGNLSLAPQTRSMVWVLVDLPKGKRAIGSKWVFRNKKDERGIVFRNKARLVTQGHTQEERIDYEEVFAPVARIEAIRMFLAYASFMGFKVYQMDVKSAFLYETIKEMVYVCQPIGFEDLDYTDKVYKVVKTLYGLHQAPRAWYETLANYLLENDFQKGKIDQTLFIKKQKGDILLVYVYVDDIIFGSTNKVMCKVKQKEDRIFISQDKYVVEILRMFGLTDGKLASTSIDTKKPLLNDHDGKDVDVHTYRYLKGKPHLGFWYPKGLPFNLVAYSDSNYAGASLDMKFTTRGCQFLGNDVVRLQALIDRWKVIITEDTIRQALRLDDAYSVNYLPNEEIFTELGRMGYEKPSIKLTFYEAFFLAQSKFLIHTIL